LINFVNLKYNEGMSKKIKPVHANGTTWMERFRGALTIMCGAEPPLKMCEMWINNEQDEHASDPLQNWVGMQKSTPKWAQCIVTIEAAQVWADSPEEGEDHQPKITKETECA
jgi:hypothetical protein